MDNKVELKNKLSELKNWFDENPNMPEEINNLLLMRFLKCMNGDVEKTKKVIELNYTMRNQNADIFLERDPLEEQLNNAKEVLDLALLPGLTKERYKVTVYSLNDPDVNKFNQLYESKLFFMLADSRFTLPDIKPDAKDSNANIDEASAQVDTDANDKADNDAEGDADNDAEYDMFQSLADGDVQVVDMTNITLSRAFRTSIRIMRMQNKFLEEAFPTRLRAMHAINCPSFINKLISFARPFISDDVFKIAHFHTEGIESLYEHIPRDMLPEEYGGKAGKMADLKQQWLQLIQEKRDYLMDAKQWKAEIVEHKKRWLFF